MIHVLIGTRAQLIKMIPVMHALKEQRIEYNLIFMAQHHETIYEIIDQFQLKRPDYILGDTGNDIVTSKAMFFWSIKTLFHGLVNKKTIFKHDKKGIVLVHGDAPPLLLGSLIAKAQKLKVAAVEAGLRSFNFFKPFPEELIRVIATKTGLVDIFFCQDQTSMKNVEKYRRVAYNSNGNTIFDMLNLAEKFNSNHTSNFVANKDNEYAIVTIHRYELISRSEKLIQACEIIMEISRSMKLLFILHPPTKAALIKFNLYKTLDECINITLLPRQNFLEFNRYMSNTEFIISDGGSNQEESAYLGIPCLLLRNESERSEGLDKNVVLSKFDSTLIDHFVKNYTDYRIKTTLKGKSPTEIIVDKALPFQ